MRLKKYAWLLTGSLAALVTMIVVPELHRRPGRSPSLAQRPVEEARVAVEKRPEPQRFELSSTTERKSEPKKLPARASLQDRLAEFSKMVDEEPDPALFESFLVDWIAGLKPAEMPTALAFLQKEGLTAPLALDVETRLVRQWASGNATAALQWVNGLEPGPLRDLALDNVAIVLSQQDIDGTVAWARQLPEGDERDRVAAAVANEALRTEPAEALRLADNLPSTPANDDLIRRAAMEWTSQDQPKALQWAEQLADDAFRTQVLSGVAIAWSDRDPISAGQLVINELPTGRPQEDALVGIAQRWAQQSPKAAAQWISSFPSGDLRSAAVESVSAIWNQSDPKAAQNWKTSFNAPVSPTHIY